MEVTSIEPTAAMHSHMAFFRTLPWCAKLLDDSTLDIAPTLCRESKESTEDALFAQTLNTHDTIRKTLTLTKRRTSPRERIDEIGILMELGEGLNGGPHACHGGVVATILDDCCGQLLTVNGLGKKTGADVPNDTGIVTASASIKYLKVVVTPQVVLARAWYREIKGRKYLIDAVLEDGEGTALAKAETLWMEVKLKPMAKL